jgi:hypothetical protein
LSQSTDKVEFGTRVSNVGKKKGSISTQVTGGSAISRSGDFTGEVVVGSRWMGVMLDDQADVLIVSLGESGMDMDGFQGRVMNCAARRRAVTFLSVNWQQDQ